MTPGNPEAKVGDPLFLLAFEHAPIGMALVGPDYRLQRVNKALTEILGYSEQELLARTFVDLTHPDDIHRDTNLGDFLFREEVPTHRLEKRFITKQGELVWLDVAAFVIRDAQQQPLYGLVMVQDITERRDNEVALRTSEERYRSFVVNSSEAIWRFELPQPIPVDMPSDQQIETIYKDAYLAECNDAMAKLYGHERAEDIRGAGISEFISLENPYNLASLKTFVGNHYRLHNTRAIIPDQKGGARQFSTSVIGIVVNGFLLRVWGTQRDETAQRQAEEHLQQSQQQLRALAAHLQDLRERERVNLARELHDHLGQALTSLKLDLFRVTKQLESPLEDDARVQMLARLNGTMELIGETIDRVKGISTELRPGVLDKFGLSAAIEWQCGEFELRSGIGCECQAPEIGPKLTPEQSTAIFRILQEALTNIARHAHATKVSVMLDSGAGEVVLSIRDNGRGITSAEIAAPDSLGLLGMRERAEILGGQFKVEGAPGHTQVNVRVPVEAELGAQVSSRSLSQ